MAAFGTMEAEIIHRVCEKVKVLGALTNVWKESSLSGRVEMGMIESLAIPAMLYG